MYKDIRLNIEKVATLQRVSPEFLLSSYKIETLEDIITNDLIVKLTSYVACSDEKIITTKHPASVWEHFKLQYMPLWFINRYPVKFSDFTIKVKEVFPEYACLDKDNKRHLHFRIC